MVRPRGSIPISLPCRALTARGSLERQFRNGTHPGHRFHVFLICVYYITIKPVCQPQILPLLVHEPSLTAVRLARPRTAWEFAKLPFCCAKPRFLRLTPIHPIKSRNAPQRRDFPIQSSRAKSHCRSTCSVKKPWRAFLRTSYPRFRSANSAKFRFAHLARSSKSHYRSTYSRPQPKIPAGGAQRNFPCPHESSCTSYNLLGRVSLAPLHLLAATDLPQHPPLAAEVVVGPQGDGPVGGV